MKQPDYHLVRITRQAKAALLKYTTLKNKGSAMQVNASQFISQAIIEHIARQTSK